MSVHSGKFAAVNGKSSLGSWSVNDSQTSAVIKASNTNNGTARRVGVRAWTGTYKQYIDVPEVMPGESFTFLGFTCPEDDISTDGGIVSGTAIVDSIVVTWNWETGEPINIVTNFSGDLAITYDTDTAPVDATDLTAPSLCGILPKYVKYSGTAATDTTLANITQASLTISAGNASYVNSSTACNTGRKAGPIDLQLSLTEQNTEQHEDLQIGTEWQFKLYTTDTRFWWIKTGLIEGYSNFTVDRESNAMISRNLDISWNAVPLDGHSTGAIILPGATQWFPTPP